MATLSDVAARAGVSISAVSRVLSETATARVSDETRRRIHDAARELNYRPNFAGRALKFARTNAIALVVPDLTNALFTELMRGVEDEAIDLGYIVLLARAESMQPGGDTIERLIGEGRIDGILVQVGDSVPEEELERLLSAAPVILVNSRRAGHVGSVTLEDAEAARVATRHLVELGHRRIALVNGVPHNETAVSREEGYQEVMKSAGLPVEDSWVTHLGYQPVQGADALRQLLALEPRPTAVVIANINAGFGALAEARRLGVRVPEDLSIVAIHDAWTADATGPPLTTVRLPLIELGRQSMRSIYERLNGGAVGDLRVSEPPPELIVRQSTAPPTEG